MSTPSLQDQEAVRLASLQDAESKASALFSEIESTLVRPGISEKSLSDAIHALGQERHNVRTHWHKRVVRSGPNALRPFEDNPPDRIIEDDDILVVDLGPVFEKWEADFGRTYVLGNDPAKLALRDALEPMWDAIKAWFDKAGPDVTGEELFNVAKGMAEEQGWNWGAEIAGHIVGLFPHERIPRDKKRLYITEGNGERMRETGKDGFVRHWILEVHLRSKDGKLGGFYEKLLV